MKILKKNVTNPERQMNNSYTPKMNPEIYKERYKLSEKVGATSIKKDNTEFENEILKETRI